MAHHYPCAHTRNTLLCQAMGQTSIGSERFIRLANRIDYPRLVGGSFRKELYTLYRHGGYAERGVSFDAVVTQGALVKHANKIGLFEPFDVRIIVTNGSSLTSASGARPWEKGYVSKKVMIRVDPSDDDWHARLVKKVLTHYDPSGTVSHSNLVVAFVKSDRKTSLSASNPALMIGELMSLRNAEVYAVVEKSTTTVARKSVGAYVRKTLTREEVRQQLAIASEAIEKQQQQDKTAASIKKKSASNMPIRSQIPLKMPSQPLDDLAKTLNERIGNEIFAATSAAYEQGLAEGKGKHVAGRKAVEALIADPLFVTRAVHKAIAEDDSVYAKADPLTPTAQKYWAKRQMNIASLVNEFSSKIAPRVSELNVSSLYRPVGSGKQKAAAAASAGNAGNLPIGDSLGASARSFNADLAKKAIADASIGCGLWDSFKHWVGYDGCCDDGGPGYGPACDVGYRGAPFCGYNHGCLPALHCVPNRCITDPHHGHHHHHHDKNVVKQKVIVRVHGGGRRAAKKGAHVHVAKDGDESASSGDEAVDFDRAQRRAKGMAWRHVNSDGEDDDHEGHAIVDCDDEYCNHPVVALSKGHNNHHHGQAPAVSVVTKNKVIVGGEDYHHHHHHLDKNNYSNFLAILNEAGCVTDGKDSVYLALSNTVLTDANMAKVRAGGCGKFIDRYRVMCHTDAHSLHHGCFRHPTITGGVLMISVAGVHYALHAVEAGAALVLAAGAALKHATVDTVHFVTCPGYGHHVRFLPFPALHIHFPHHGHRHSYHHHLIGQSVQQQQSHKKTTVDPTEDI